MDSPSLAPELSTSTAVLDQETPHEYLHLPKNVLEHIFTSLAPRDLSLASGVATSWRSTASLAPWDTFYSQRWPVTPLDSSRAAYTSWHSLFSSRMTLARSFKGRPQLDRLSGHTSGVKVAKILSESDLLLTGSVDRRLALWDLETGTRLASSLQHAGTVRSIAIDDELLVTGSSDHRIRVWRTRRDENTPEEDEAEEGGVQHAHDHQQHINTSITNISPPPPSISQLERRRKDFPFHIEGARTVLAGGHTGPVTALELAPTALFSGSWDYCVRVWDRNSNQDEEEDVNGGGNVGNVNDNTNNFISASLECIQVLHFEDMVTDMSFKRAKLFVAAGSEAHIVDAAAGGGLRRVSSFHRHVSNSVVTAVEASEDERYLFYSTADGGVYACDVRDPRHHHHFHSSTTTNSSTNSARSSSFDPGFSCSSAVTGLSWDFPWLAASLQNGEILLLNAENTLLGGYNEHSGSGNSNYISTTGAASGDGGRGGASNIASASAGSSRGGGGGGQSSRWPSRALTAGVPGGAQCVDINGKWLVAGYESGCIVSWDFTRAEEAERAAEALRIGRRKKREERRKNQPAKNKCKKQPPHGHQEKGQGSIVPSSSAVPIPSQSKPNQIDNSISTLAAVGTSAGGPSDGTSDGTSSGGGGGRDGSGQRGRDSWHVLRMTRSNSNPSV